MTIFLSIVILILLAYVVYKEAFEKKPDNVILDLSYKKMGSLNEHLIDLKKT